MRWLEPARPGPAGVARPGDGPPIVLLHGVPTSAELWRRVLPHLADEPCAAWELIGYGDSIPAGRQRDLSLSRQADHLIAWLEAVPGRPAILTGHDLGGGVAQIAAARRPELCAGLVLTNAVAYDSWPVLPMRLLRTAGAVLRRVPEPVWRAVFRAALTRMHRDADVGRESAAVHWSHYARHDGAAALVRQARWLDAADTLAVADALPRLDVPARVVWGDADRFQPIRWGARLASDLGTTVRALPGGRHYTPEDHPVAVATAILEVSAEARDRESRAS